MNYEPMLDTLRSLAEDCAQDDVAAVGNRLPELSRVLKAAAERIQRLTADLNLSGPDSACCRARHRAEDECDQLRARVESLSTDLVDARTALRAPELHWDCQQKIDKIEEELAAAKAPPDLSDTHVDRVARHLFRTFDDVNIGREPLHEFDVMLECERGEHWYALAREAIRLGAVVTIEEVP